MHIRFIFILCVALTASMLLAGDPRKPYDPEADARAQIDSATARAAKAGKHVLVQVGGNWCSWCLKLDKLYKDDKAVNKALQNNYEVVFLNYSDENKNEKIMAELGFPQRFGFPVLVVLDANGKRLHTQNSVYLEEGEGHSPARVLEFLKMWSPKALDPASYTEQ